MLCAATIESNTQKTSGLHGNGRIDRIDIPDTRWPELFYRVVDFSFDSGLSPAEFRRQKVGAFSQSFPTRIIPGCKISPAKYHVAKIRGHLFTHCVDDLRFDDTRQPDRFAQRTILADVTHDLPELGTIVCDQIFNYRFGQIAFEFADRLPRISVELLDLSSENRRDGCLAGCEDCS